MVGEWQQIQLGKVCLKIGSGATPRGGKDAYRGGNTALVRSQNIYNDRFTRDGLVYINDSQAHELRNVVIEKGDVLLNITGDSVARCCQIDPDILPARVNQHVAIIRTMPDLLDTRFLRYVLISPSMQDHLLTLASAGATRNALTKTMIESLNFRAPSIPEQRAIAHILGTLDDKIELNRKQNETLEEMARTIFRAWFVDFAPVRAKMDGRWRRGESLPGLPAHLYDLFPDRLVESELGEIPEGWRVGSITDTVEIIGGGTPKTSVSEYWNGEIPWFSVVDTPLLGDVFVVETEKSITQAGLNESSARLIPKGTTIISARGTIGNLAIAGRSMAFNQSCYALRGKSGSGNYYVFYSAQHMVERLKTMAHGSVFSTITRNTFESVYTVLPPENVLQQFEKNSTKLLDSILANVNESRSLTQLRDTLLPKLISGELRVGDVEHIVGAAV